MILSFLFVLGLDVMQFYYRESGPGDLGLSHGLEVPHLLLINIYTPRPHVCDGSGVIVIVLTPSVCASVTMCASVCSSLSQPKGQMYIEYLNFGMEVKWTDI